MQEWLDDDNNWLNPRTMWWMLANIACEVHNIAPRIVGGKTKPLMEFLKFVNSPEYHKEDLLKKPVKDMTPEEEAEAREIATQHMMGAFGGILNIDPSGIKNGSV